LIGSQQQQQQQQKNIKPLLPWLVYKPVDYFVGPGNLLISPVARVYELI
jgi:hypothetical protein